MQAARQRDRFGAGGDGAETLHQAGAVGLVEQATERRRQRQRVGADDVAGDLDLAIGVDEFADPLGEQRRPKALGGADRAQVFAGLDAVAMVLRGFRPGVARLLRASGWRKG